MSDHAWLKLVEVSGPFLTEPVLRDVFPQGMNALEPRRRQRLRSTYEEWEQAVEGREDDVADVHQAWVKGVIEEILQFHGSVTRSQEDMPSRLKLDLVEHGVTLAPDVALVDRTAAENGLFCISVLEPGMPLDETTVEDGYAATSIERMVILLRGIGLPLGLITNGEQWCLIHAVEGKPVGYATWYARLWFLEPDTLRAFSSLLEMSRFFGPDEETLQQLYAKSEKHQDEVTEALGDQVARAVEVLIQALDQADEDRNRELLKDVDPTELYEAGLTVMMRLVFLMAAEERGLLLLGDPRYDANYSVSNLRGRLVRLDEGVLSTKYGAWAQLLALFRTVFGGVEHPSLRLPALGGSLFDPDRFPFLEGREKGTSWRDHPAAPLPIDDRTVLLLLEAIQLFEGRALSYRALDVEQIGHVYEGLLERTVKRVDKITLDLRGGASAKDTVFSLEELEAAHAEGRGLLIEVIEEKTKRSTGAIGSDLDRAVEDELSNRLSTACHGDAQLKGRVLPFVHLLKTDPWNDPIVHPAGAFVVGLGQDRRQSGAHYTPKTLTERIVEETLEPLVFVGPREGVPQSDWTLKSAEELLELKICDPAMGSGAFLVQVCRWLSDRLVEAWARDELDGIRFNETGKAFREPDFRGVQNPIPRSADDRADLARRLIAEKCLYGVDVNPLAVELAKLSIWLITMSKGRPFGFLDHNLRQGNSLLGIWRLEQLIEFDLKPTAGTQARLFGRSIKSTVDEALALRQRIRSTPIRDIKDVDTMAALDKEARRIMTIPTFLADAFVGIEMAETNARRKSSRLSVLSSTAEMIANGDTMAAGKIRVEALEDLAKDEPRGLSREPFHWPLEFPEVFLEERGGFDAFVGNPPFLGGQRLREAFGISFRNWVVEAIADGTRGSADLVAYFFLRVFDLLRGGGTFGLLAVNTISEGDTRQVGLERMLQSGATIFAAYPNEPWPGSAAVVTSRIHMAKGEWGGRRSIFGRAVPHISAFLSDREEWSPKPLEANKGIAFQGSIVLGSGFVLEPDHAQRMLSADPRNADVLFPYINGQDLNSHPEQKPSRWCINFWDWPEERAKEYALPYAHILQHVKPERQRKKDNGDFKLRSPLPQRWWQHAEKRPALYHAIGRGEYFEKHPQGYCSNTPANDGVLLVTRHTKHLCFGVCRENYIFSDALVVLVGQQNFFFCTSIFHEAWSRHNGSHLESRLRYTPADVFETFPFPKSVAQEAFKIGGDFDLQRRTFAKKHEVGFTDFMNQFHSVSCNEDLMIQCREAQIKIDEALANFYGWTDLELDHDFRPVEYLPEGDNVRFTISDEMRREVLHRLALLNKERWEAEQVGNG